MTSTKCPTQTPSADAIDATDPDLPRVPCTDSASASERCLTLRKLGPLVSEAFQAALAHESTPAYAELDARYRDLETHFDHLAQEIWATPAQTWQDIVERAELAYAYADEDLSKHRKGDYAATRATAELVMSILELTGGEAWRRTK